MSPRCGPGTSSCSGCADSESFAPCCPRKIQVISKSLIAQPFIFTSLCFSAIRYSYETNQNDAKNLNIQTDFVPLYSESGRFKRDTSSELSSESDETTTTANKIYINENKNKSEATGGLTDDFLKNQVFQNKTEKEDVKTTHKDYSFDNVSLRSTVTVMHRLQHYTIS